MLLYIFVLLCFNNILSSSRWPACTCLINFFTTLDQNRSIVTGVATSVCYISIFLASFTFPLLSDESVLDAYGSFWLYSGIGVLGLLFVIFVLPQDDDAER